MRTHMLRGLHNLSTKTTKTVPRNVWLLQRVETAEVCLS